jgi:SNF2 family DNA or RNA helicase
MTSFYETTIYVELPENQFPIDFEIVSIKSTTYEKKMIFKVTQNGKLYYLSHYPRSNNELYLFLEIKNGSPIWELKYEIGPYTLYSSKYRFPIQVKINPDNDLIHEYLNTSIAINTVFSENYDKLPIFDKADFSSKSFIPYEDPVEPPNTFKIKLYEYQKRSLGKMLKMEKGETSFTVKYTSPITFCNQEYIYDPISNQRVMEDKYLNINIRGGVLSDEMGLGKTITSVALIATNPAPNEHPAAKYSDDYQMDKLFTKATLVLCPSHLTKQWETEAKRCNSKFNILTIVTKKDMDKLTVTDIQNADIIITSHQFLMNFKYYPTLHYKSVTPSNYSSYDRKFALKAKLQTLMKDQVQLLALQTPVFEFFFFQRIILDEGHEIFGEMLGSGSLSRYMADWVSSMDANYYWYVSGTPFVNFLGVKNSANFINLKLVEKERQLNFNYSREFTNARSATTNIELFNFMSKEYMWNNILSKICIRHRKPDVENQIQIPGFEEKLIWVKFTELEKQLYEAKKGKVPNHYLQQLCCHPMVIESTKKIFGDVEVDLSLMQDKLIDYHKKNYETYKHKLTLLDKTKPEYFMLKKTYESSMNESHYLYTILSQMKEKPIEDDQNCSICMDALENPTVTACGHIFCYDCLKMCLGDKKKCPMCKADLSGKELLVVNKPPTKKLEETNPLITKYGSKLGKAISIIRTLVAQPTSRIIIFSQWDDMLYLIGKTLSENGIENCFVKGNVWSRNSAINKFKAGKNSEGQENKVIMLSLKNAASGTNLTEATHILFIEPINASKEECKAIEGQAIGRACRVGQKNKVTVMRILIENSVEEEIYKRSYNNDVVVDFKNEETLIKELLPVVKPKEMVI